MRAQMDFQRAQFCALSGAQGTDGAQIGNLNCALISLCYYYYFLIKGTGHRKIYKSQKRGKNAKIALLGGKTGTAKRNPAIRFELCPLPSTAWRALA